MAEIAFFGLGTMGVPMAINLLKAGHHLHVLPHNGHMDGPLAVQKYGACIHETLQKTVGDAEFIISVVPDDAAVRDLYLNQAMLEAIRPGTIIIEMTSCSPEIVREVARFFAEKQVRLIDAPITGALPKAIDGTLTIMGAGDPAAFAAAEGVFSAISERVFQLGEIRQRQAHQGHDQPAGSHQSCRCGRVLPLCPVGRARHGDPAAGRGRQRRWFDAIRKELQQNGRRRLPSDLCSCPASERHVHRSCQRPKPGAFPSLVGRSLSPFQACGSIR